MEMEMFISVAVWSFQKERCQDTVSSPKIAFCRHWEPLELENKFMLF